MWGFISAQFYLFRIFESDALKSMSKRWKVFCHHCSLNKHTETCFGKEHHLCHRFVSMISVCQRVVFNRLMRVCLHAKMREEKDNCRHELQVITWINSKYAESRNRENRETENGCHGNGSMLLLWNNDELIVAIRGDCVTRAATLKANCVFYFLSRVRGHCGFVRDTEKKVVHHHKQDVDHLYSPQAGWSYAVVAQSSRFSRQ